MHQHSEALHLWCSDLHVVTTSLPHPAQGYPFGPAQCNKSANTPSIIQSYTGAWDFQNTSGPQGLSVVVEYNLSLPSSSTPTDQTYRTPGMLNAAVRGWWASQVTVIAGPGIRNELLALQSFPKPADRLRLDFSSLLGPLFYCWVVQLLLPTMLQQLVYEKEKRLRMMMKMHGLGDAAYWVVTYIWYM